MEFKVGDKVWASGPGNGVVACIGNNDDSYPIEVDFNNDDNDSYTSDGKRFDTHVERSLYHGWDLKVVGEKFPVKCWLIKYSNGYMCDRVFKSEEAANTYNACDGGATYHEVNI